MNKPQRDEKGRFLKGHKLGFKKGNKCAFKSGDSGGGIYEDSTPLYREWERCRIRAKYQHKYEYTSSAKYYAHVRCCKRWDDYLNFKADMGPTYKEGLQLDRIDWLGDYCPENCRWVTAKQQNANRHFWRKESFEEIRRAKGDEVADHVIEIWRRWEETHIVRRRLTE